MTSGSQSGLAVLCSALFLAALSAQAPAQAQGLSMVGDGEAPLEINAEQGIEWRRDTKQYIARGDARAAQGDIEVFADVLTAHYRESQAGDTEIYRIDAEGNVRIVSPSEQVSGDLGRYEVDRGLLVLWGDDLRLETAEDVITARDSLEYWEQQNIAVARGDAVAIRADRRLRADILTAQFVPDGEDNLAIKQVDAEGNVEVMTPTEFARGDKGIYYVDKQLVTLSGAVRITRGENQLSGRYAEVNLETGVSRLLGGPPGSPQTERVRGLLVPRRKPDQPGDS